MRVNYVSIAEHDLANPIQNQIQLNELTKRDLRAIGSVSNLRVLEVGPGLGHLTNLLIDSGATVYVADIVDNYLNHIQLDACNKAVFDIQDSDGVPESWFASFDLIVMTDVLEHLTHPQDALLVTKSLLKAGGKLYVRVPAHESLISYSMELGCPHALVHLRTYDKTSLRRELTSAGLRCLKGPRYSIKAARQPGRLLSTPNVFASRKIDSLRKLYGVQELVDDRPRTTAVTTSKTFFHMTKFSKRIIMHLLTRPGEVWCLSSHLK
jgi:SAM-dependent methyltransferase